MSAGGGIFMSTEASGQCPRLSPLATTCSTKRHGNHSYSQAARCSARTESRDQQGCTVCAAAALITSITETPARDETQGPRGLRGSSSSTTLSQSESLSDPPALSAPACCSPGRNRSLFSPNPRHSKTRLPNNSNYSGKQTS